MNKALLLTLFFTGFQPTVTNGDSVIDKLGVFNGSTLLATDPIAKSIAMILYLGEVACSGVLIAPDVLLTAAHCTRNGAGDVGSEVKFLGATSGECSIAVVDKVSYHPDAISDDTSEGKSMLPDLALVHLDKPLCGVNPAHVDPGLILKPGDRISLAGYGMGNKSIDQAEKTQMVLLDETEEALLKTYEGEAAEEVAYVRGFLSQNMKYYRLGTPVENSSVICVGDSGGPAYIEKNNNAYLVGLNSIGLPHSLGKECANSYLTGITNLKPYLGWILEQLPAQKQANP